jgi:hypothetical protein
MAAAETSPAISTLPEKAVGVVHQASSTASMVSGPADPPDAVSVQFVPDPLAILGQPRVFVAHPVTSAALMNSPTANDCKVDVVRAVPEMVPVNADCVPSIS